MSRAVIVVGVVPGHPPTVAEVAAALADDLRADLIFAYVDPAMVAVPDSSGQRRLVPIDPDVFGDRTAVELGELDDQLAAVMADRRLGWRVEHLGGDPARELARLAADADARLLVIGTRQQGWRGRMAEFFTGSVAVQLAHHQSRPVVVVPTSAVGFGQPEPWA